MCSDCGYTRTANHSFSPQWASNAETHWHVCTVCGAKDDESVHVPGSAATETNAQTCTICGYELSPALGSNDTESTVASPTDSEASNMVLWIIIPVISGVVGGGIVFILTKKKSR